MKLGNLYNLDSFQSFLDSGRKPGFADAYAGTVLARNLTAISPRIMEKKFPELSFVNSGITADNSGGYARRIQSLRLQALGGFTSSTDTDNNKGKISLAGEDNYLKVLVREAMSKWSDDEIKEAELQNINLPSRYIETHNQIYMREIDTVGFVGVDGKEGLLNNSAFTSGAAAGAISTLSAAEMYAEISDLIEAQKNAVNNTPEYSADRVVMPVDVLNKLQSTILNSAASSASVLKALQDNYPGITFTATHRAASVGGSSRTVAFSTNNESMIMRIPVPLTIGEIVKISSFDFQVDSKYRVAGLDVLEATAGYILTGL